LVITTEKFPVFKLDAGTFIPVPSGKPVVVLYSIPYWVIAAHPVTVIVAAGVPVVGDTDKLAFVVTAGKVFTPLPTATMLNGEAILPPVRLILPL
jgi:hypothetical protein